MNPGFTGKVSTLIQFPLEPGYYCYSILNQAVADFEHGLHSILITSVRMLELGTSFDEPDALTSSVSSGFLHDTSKTQLAPNIKIMVQG